MGFEVDFLPVGEGEKSGDAIAFRCGNLTGARNEQFVMVIDGGTLDSGDTLVEHIQRVYGTGRVNLAVSSHPDGDHASGLYRVLEKLRVGHLWMHRPWEHSPDIKHMFDDGILSNDRLSRKMQKALSDAWDLEKLANRKGITITEPFADGEANQQYRGIYILGPTEDYYQSLLPRFRDMPEVKESVAAYFGARFQSLAKGTVLLADRVLETWGKETLRDPADDATSSQNNSSTIILLRVEGHDLLFTADAGVPALERAVNLAESWGISLPKCQFQQMPHHGSKRNVGPKLLNRLLGPKLPSQGTTNKTVFVSAAEEAPKHPARKVVNAYMRRGAKVLATQGVGIRHHFKAGSRGWMGNGDPAVLLAGSRGGLTMKPDIYVWKARRSPVLLAVLPPALAVFTAFPHADWKLILPLCTFCGLFMLVGQLGRDRGSQHQDRLFASWGGKPTTAMLRHRESHLDESSLATLHQSLATVTGVPAPSKRKESASPDDADRVYDAFVRYLRDATRDKQKHPLVFEENVSYGFRRNTWGLKPYGIALAGVGTAGAAVNLFRYHNGPNLGLAIASTTVSAFFLLFWIGWVNPNWVRIPAKAYAERLMEVALRMARAEPKRAGQKGRAGAGR